MHVANVEEGWQIKMTNITVECLCVSVAPKFYNLISNASTLHNVRVFVCMICLR